MFGSNDKMPVPAIAPRQAAFSRIGIKKYFRKFRQRHPAWRRPDPQQRTASGKYPLYINWLIEGSRSPQIWPHLPVLVLSSLLRYAAPAIQIKSIPAMPKRNSGTGFLAAEMKEYDA
jgi:hypothetical protein